jgi:hypothetical protein
MDAGKRVAALSIVVLSGAERASICVMFPVAGTRRPR